MSAFYDRLAATSARLLDADEAQGGKGQAIVLTHTVSGGYDPVTGTTTLPSTTTQDVFGFEEFYRATDIDGTLIQKGDRRLQLSPLNAQGGPIIAPALESTATYGGKTWTIKAVEPYAPGGTLLYIVLQLRG